MINPPLPCSHIGAPQILRMRDLRERLKLSPSHIFALIARGDFPKPFVLVPGGRSVGWVEADICQWVLDRKSAAQQEAQ